MGVHPEVSGGRVARASHGTLNITTGRDSWHYDLCPTIFPLVSASGVPKIDVLLAAVVGVCQRRMEPLTAREIDPLVIEVLAIPADVVARTHGLKGSRTEIAYRLAWARSKGRSLGLLERAPDGRWVAVAP
jgi:hypothetical protein